MNAARIDLSTATSISAIDTFAATEILGSELRPGMIVLDDLDTAGMVVTNRLARQSPRDGGPRFAGFSPEEGKTIAHGFHANRTYRVAAA